MRYKISATFFGKCDICGKEGLVFKIGDEDTKKIVVICKECVIKYKDERMSDMTEKFGRVDEESFQKGIRNLDEKN
ncbi:MAG: hypothetical protein QXD89_01570 [Candidatus Aenigmatarchaeota archaeon]